MNISGGWSKSPHFIHDAMPLMSGAEYKCTAVLVRETYGYHRSRARLTYQDFMQQTGIRSRATVAKALKEIEARRFFQRTGRESEWAICLPPGPDDGPGGQPDQADERGGRSDIAAQASPERAQRARPGGSARTLHSISALERSVFELQHAVNELQRTNGELQRSNSELSRLLTELICSIAGQSSSLNGPSACENSSVSEPRGRAGGPYRAKTEPATGSNVEPQNSHSRSNFVPLQLYKDKITPAGQERAGADNKRLPRPRGHTTGQIPGQSGNGQKLPLNSSIHAAGKPPPHPGIPRPRSAAEVELAWHPATVVWLDAGLAWPGWERLRMITERLGRKPRAEMLRKARGMWLMAGYRMSNAGGILDWYEAICRDENWQPFARRDVGAVQAPADVSAPQSPAMAMLFKMREELINGQETDDDRLFNHAASSLSPPRSRTADHPSIPALAG